MNLGGFLIRRNGLNERDLVWQGSKLLFGKRVVGEVFPDPRFPGMWRASCLGARSLSDMMNKTRAKDACEAAFASSTRRERGRQSPLGGRTADIAAIATT
jgi:hypothetical protein